MLPEIRIQLDELANAVRTFPWEDERAYAALMAQTYYYTRHTTRILALAGSRFDFEAEKTHHRFLDHCAEELKHEKLAEKDVSNLGFSLQDFPEFGSTIAFYQTHYYTIDHVTPWSVFGYILALEGLAAEHGQFIFGRIKESHGEKCGLFMKVHALEDVGHMEIALKQIAGVSSSEMSAIVSHMKTTCFLYASILKQSAEYSASVKSRAAA